MKRKMCILWISLIVISVFILPGCTANSGDTLAEIAMPETNPAADSTPETIALQAAAEIAFWSYRDGTGEIYMTKIDGSEPARLTNNASNDWDPSFSPDRSKIAFVSDRDGNWEIYTMNADGSEQKRLTNNPADDGYPRFSPDGSKIDFMSNRDGKYEIYTIKADGTQQARLTNNPVPDRTPSFVLSELNLQNK